MQEQDTEYVVDPETGCWIWQWGTRGGYGRVLRGHKLYTAHRWYWEQVHGPIPKGMQLDHMCHNADKSCPGGHDCRHRRCVNPEHLELADPARNVQRGRRARVTREQVAEIKAQPWVPRDELGARYGISGINVAVIRAGKTWKDVAPAEGFNAPERIWTGPPMPARETPLTEREIAEIRAAPRYYGSGRELAHKFGVTDGRISQIRSAHSG